MAEIRKVLALDTALMGCSVGLLDIAKGACVSAQEPMARGQSEALVPMAQEVLAKAGCPFAEIDLIAVTVGPGAFTGLRIGMAAAQGFGVALGRPVIGLITLDVLAAQYFRDHKLEEDQLLCVLIETKREDYYCRFYQTGGKPCTAPQALRKEEITAFSAGHEVIHIGDATNRFGAGPETCALPDPCLMAQMAVQQYRKEEAKPLTPLYLRGADVSKPKKESRKILET